MTFDDFWELYPRQVGKGAARRAWLKAVSISTPDNIIAAVKRYAGEVAGKEMRFVAHPSTWLNGERWADKPGANNGSAIVQPIAYHGEQSQWAQRLKNYTPGGFWASTWGNRPESAGPHDCPANLVSEWRKRQGIVVDRAGQVITALGSG